MDTAAVFLKTPNDVFDAVFSAIENAHSEILLQCYKIADDDLGRKLLLALTDKAKAGLKVRVIYDRDSYVNEVWWRPLTRVGGLVHRFQRAWFDYFAHEHTKCLVIDGVVICGGCNFQDNWRQGWFDYDVVVDGEIDTEVKQHFKSSYQPLRPDEQLAYPCNDSYVLSSSLHGAHDIEHYLAGIIHGTHNHLLCASWIFLPSMILHKALTEVLKQGKQVTIVVAQPNEFETSKGWGLGVQMAWKAQRHYLQSLKAAGAHVWICSGAYWHGKAVLVDDRVAVFGSYNCNVIEAWSRTSNLSIVLHNSNLVKEARLYHEEVLIGPEFDLLPPAAKYDWVYHYGIRVAMFVLKCLTWCSPKAACQRT